MNRRGVVLVYVMILIAITAYVSSLLLNATFSRRISSQVTINSAHSTADLGAADARVTGCLADNNWPNGLTCGGAPAGCLTGDLPGTPARPYRAVVCGGSPPCRIRINVCRPNPEIDGPSPTCPTPNCP